MAFTALLPTQVGKEWSNVPATIVTFFPDLFIVEFSFNALDERIQRHLLLFWSECCDEEIEPRIYLEVFRRRNKRWDIIPLANSNAILLGTPAPSSSAYIEHVEGRLTECVGPTSNNCGPPIPFDTRLSFTEFEQQIDLWIATADEIFGLKTDFQLFDPDFFGCDSDRCIGRDPGWYVTFEIDPLSSIGLLLTGLGIDYSSLDLTFRV